MIEQVWTGSDFACLSTDGRARLLRTAEEVTLLAGRPLPASPGESQAGLVIDGMLRVYVTSGHRQVTVRYAESGAAFGVPHLGPQDGATSVAAGAQAVLDSRVLVFRRDEVGALLETDPTMSRAVINGLREAHYASVSLLAENVLAPLRQRLAHHLLDLAVRQGDAIVVRSSVQDLAHAIGTVREVVTRLLKDLRAEGLIGRSGGMLVLHDLARLHRVARGAGTS
ncbi:hypothetical protein GCM10017786_08260 [Amycolatopsis deserti]|uniref:HTH crp-type domain-containing protein n=1 Tax=Amycolatopsis deserti TaxID=185696 RepID=A0ABQ3IH86_9PSEU|nr:Crp/Fnr family transcriptional regulator [Amycolatopsis deserti]GHE80477.1 hypothetical protein GCM10017786_08260 [Amycolatopsis deserti]